MKQTIKYLIAPALCAMFLLASCTKDTLQGEDNPVVEQAIEIPLNISISALDSSQAGDTDPATRTVPSDLNLIDGAAAKIKTLWVLQFNGTTPSAKLVGSPHFIQAAAGSDLNTLANMKLVPSAATNRILWVANLPMGESYNWDSPLRLTLADAEARMFALSDEQQSWANIDKENCIMMNAYTETSVSGGTALNPQFSRTVAKLQLKITGITAGTEIVSVRLRQVATSVHLFEEAFEKRSLVLGTSIYPLGGTGIDYPLAPTAEITAINTARTGTFSWYVPRNWQGTSTSTVAKDKSKFAPASATYFEILVKTTATGKTGVFRVYPGTNQTNDYTIDPNSRYTTTLNITGIGAGVTDSRVETFPDVDHTLTAAGKTSNSFMLNPPPSGDRKYRIPVTQVNRYYVNTAANTPNAGYGLATSKIGASDTWAVTLLWSDNTDLFSTAAAADHVRLTLAGGVGPTAYFEITVPAGVPAGNFTIKLAKTSAPAVILWSWHFWVTPYNPDQFDPSTINNTKVNGGGIPAGIFTYPVSGGQVERYTGTLWSGVYAAKVMMDRPLGAIETFDTKPAEAVDRGILHYQFGRKDPFPTASTQEGAIVTTRVSDDTQVPILTAVQNPSLFYNRTSSGGNWTNEATATTYLWNDPLVLSASAGKTIYDPCPVGWKMPINGTWDDFAHTRTANNATRDLGWSFGRGIGSAYSAIGGVRYWPGNATDNVAGRIWYPGMRVRAQTNGLVTAGGEPFGHYWSSSPSPSIAGYGTDFKFTSSIVDPSYVIDRSAGFSVRCIKE